LPNDVKAIELWPCRYDAPCKVNNCRARATTIARSVDSGGRPRHQHELCQVHAEQVAERERGKGASDHNEGGEIVRWLESNEKLKPLAVRQSKPRSEPPRPRKRRRNGRPWREGRAVTYVIN
jgi:hypothetical protein